MQLVALAPRKDVLTLTACRNEGTRPVLNVVASSYAQVRLQPALWALYGLGLFFGNGSKDSISRTPYVWRRLGFGLLQL